MLLSVALGLFVLPLHADEGMWLPAEVPSQGDELVARGLLVEPNELSSEDGLLGAVASLGHCTAAFVGKDGLLATNAHCTRAYLQYASQGVGKDLMEEGFMAADRSEELSAGPSARVFLTEEISDVTTRVLKRAKGRRLKDAERFRRVDRARKEIASECEEASADRRCRVIAFDGGLAYKLVVEREIRDVRLVYAPSDAIAMFGGETDNWMWPRHCGDFAFLRAYVGADGESADYGTDNVPLEVERFFPLSDSGVEEGDFVWMAGFPGSTYRTRSAAEGIHAATERYPKGIEIFTELMDILRGHAKTNRDARIKLKNAMFGLSNRRKSYQGMVANFESSDFVATKEAERAALAQWISEERRRKRLYQSDIEDFNAAMDAQIAAAQRNRLMGLMGWAPRLLRTARTAYRWSLEQEKNNLDRRRGYQDRDKTRIEADFRSMDRSYYGPADRELAHRIFSWILELDEAQAIAPISEFVSSAGGLEQGLDSLYDASGMLSESTRLGLLDASPEDHRASEDPWMRLAVAMEDWQDAQRNEDEARRGAMIRLRPRYVEALKEMKGGDFYSDANGTLRLSFGEVAGYSPQEAVQYAPQTSLAGLLAKGGEGEFEVDAELGRVAGVMGEAAAAAIPVNFLSTLDNTGGNSGSPTLNGKGELVGWVFDRNWDAVAADWVFDPEMTRSIHVDARYAIWLLREVHGASSILEELGVTREEQSQ